MPDKPSEGIGPKSGLKKNGSTPVAHPIATNTLSVNKLPVVATKTSIAPETQLELFVDKEKEIDGVGMGVLSDGTAFLTGRGLARLCGVSNARIVELGQNWSTATTNAMVEGVKKILQDKGLKGDKPYIEVRRRSGSFYAYSDAVCLAVLEYYAFDQPTDEAKKNFRLLAGKALHDFIYIQVGYDPSNHVPEVWRQFHDRISLTYNSVPPGYFSVFKEIADVIVHLGQNGLKIDSSFVPDISVGIHWGKHWEDSDLKKMYGDRIKFEHNYPNYFPQARSNPQLPWCYPEMSLGEFKRWLRETYIKGGKFEKYLTDQANKKSLPPSFVQLAIAVYRDNDSPKLLS
ncbi:MAG: hypothetical protein ABSB42_22025 [Tepidisphaeraceae bacterium]|jgi:hypothetical protein